MKATTLPRRVYLLLFAGLLALCLGGAWAATTPGNLLESKLGGGTILSAPAQKLIPAVRDCVKENAVHPAEIVTATLKGGRADTDAIAPRVTVAAIEGLGSNPSSPVVGEIVYASVKAAPAVVLETVRASVKAAPGCAKAIVKAAVAAVPNPKAEVPVTSGSTSSTRDFSKDGDGYAKDDSKGPPPDAALEPITEAIAQAAYQADPSLSYPDLLSAAQGGGNGGGDPGTYPGYYYPPLDTSKTGTTSTSMPTPPVVSR